VLLLILTSTAALAATAEELADAMAIPAADTVALELISVDDRATAAMEAFGVLRPVEGKTMGFIFTGAVGATSWDTDLGAGGAAEDLVTFSMTMQVPEDANSLFYEFYFLSAEYPDFVGSDFNDKFEANVTGSAWTGNAAVDRAGNVISVNSGLIIVTDPADLNGINFGDGRGGGTGWLLNAIPVTAGEEVTLELTVYDEGDGIYDSGALLDNFRWSDQVIDYPVIVEPIAVAYVWPKRSPPEGGELISFYGEKFNELCRVAFDGEFVETDFIDDENLTAVTPAHEPGAVDITLDCAGDAAVLTDGMYYYEVLDEGSVPPIIDAVTPSEVDIAGGSTVIVTGSQLVEGSVLTFDGAPMDFTRVSDEELSFVAPAHDAGLVDLSVETPDGLNDTRYGALLYREAVAYVGGDDTGGGGDDGGTSDGGDGDGESDEKGCSAAASGSSAPGGLAGLMVLAGLAVATRRRR